MDDDDREASIQSLRDELEKSRLYCEALFSELQSALEQKEKDEISARHVEALAHIRKLKTLLDSLEQEDF